MELYYFFVLFLKRAHYHLQYSDFQELEMKLFNAFLLYLLSLIRPKDKMIEFYKLEELNSRVLTYITYLRCLIIYYIYFKNKMILIYFHCARFLTTYISYIFYETNSLKSSETNKIYICIGSLYKTTITQKYQNNSAGTLP